MFGNVKADIKNNKGNKKAIFIIVFFRITHFFCIRRKNIIYNLAGIPFRILYRLIVEWLLGVEIPASTSIGKGLILHHGQGLVVHANTIIGENVTLKHNTTLGIKESGPNMGAPVIGNNVVIHPHVVIFGNITVAENVVVGAGAVINKSVSPNSVVVGNPQKIVRKIA
ncbi:serine O-acetyltransferase [Vibrio diabolicus]|uniref:serine O-acetyltransferase n=1 Tax=Vibrio diabolicus TaxID=50719 RepID=UPI00293FAC23|nr:hypothetical protein [Vibrio diabolicus]MDV5037638.1 hypothetical protein [Vibrio diabolicus]